MSHRPAPLRMEPATGCARPEWNRDLLVPRSVLSPGPDSHLGP